MEQRLSCITLGVANLEASAAFYDSLGWKRVPNAGDKIVVFDLLHGGSLSLFPREKLAEDIGPESGGTNAGAFSGITLSYNVRSKDEVEPVLELAAKAGGKVLKAATAPFWAPDTGMHGYFRDLDGHVWEVCFNPYSKLRSDGAFRWLGYEHDK